MKWLAVVAVLMLTVMTTGSIANVNPRAEELVQYLDYLNTNYSDVHVSPSYEPHSEQAPRLKMWKDLEVLEGVIRGETSAPPKSLITIACVKPACGGKPGPCHTCQAH